jgi:hypothetical protein
VWLALFYRILQAVVCLDDGDCKIRNGLVAAEDDSTLDTSIACDSCDKWYLFFVILYEVINWDLGTIFLF